MNDLEITAIKKALAKGGLYWRFDPSEKALRVVSIGAALQTDEDDEPEPSEVAHLENGSYVALYNADLCQFVILKPVSIASE